VVRLNTYFTAFLEPVRATTMCKPRFGVYFFLDHEVDVFAV